MTWTLPQPLLLFNRSNCYQLCWPSIPNHPHIWNARMVNARDQFKKCCSWSIDTCLQVSGITGHSVILRLENFPKKDSLDMTLCQENMCQLLGQQRHPPLKRKELDIKMISVKCKHHRRSGVSEASHIWDQLRSAEQQEIEEHLWILAPEYVWKIKEGRLRVFANCFGWQHLIAAS